MQPPSRQARQEQKPDDPLASLASRLKRLLWWRFALLLFLAIFALAALFAWRTPPWQAPDEPAHYAYVATVARTGRPPVLEAHCYNEAYKNSLVSSNFAQPIDFQRFCYEGHQPPLFYYLAAPLFWLSGGSLLALRLFCALLGAGTVVAAWGIVRAAGGDAPLAAATAATVGLVPQFLAIIGSLNNDALTFLIVALAVWQMVGIVRGPRSKVRGPRAKGKRQKAKGKRQKAEGLDGSWLRLGLLVGLALITKTLAWVVLPLAALTFLLTSLPKAAEHQKPPISHSRHFVSNLQFPLLALALAALFILPWFARNASVYRGLDVMGLQRHDAIAVGQPRTAAEIEARGVGGTIANGAQTVFHSFWGQFGWMKAPLQPWEYGVLALMTGLAALGLLGWAVRRGWRAWGIDPRALLLFGAWVLVNGALLLYYNLEFVQYQGRYLFSALIPIAFFLVAGLGAWLPARLRPLPWAALLLFLFYLDALAIVERLPDMMTY